MEQNEDQNPSSFIIHELLGEQQATTEYHDSALLDLEPSIAAMAYDSLKAEKPKLVQAYEKILSLKLNEDLLATVDHETGKNVIQVQNVSIRRAQMYQLIDSGLDKTMHEANIKENIGTAMQVINAMKKMIGGAIKDTPQAALPWAVVCVSLEILTNPMSQIEANRIAVKYVGDTINWYWEHATRLFDNENDKEKHILEGLQRELQAAFINFYKKLLQFQMESICDYRYRGFVFLRDLVKLNDWDGALKLIQEDDDSLCKKVNGFLRHKMESQLESLTLQIKAQGEYHRTQEDQQCLRDLFITDPRDDMTRIERTKGGLLEDSYQWILENSKYQEWHHNDRNQLLWLSGDPGKVKTMLLCGIVHELMRQPGPSLITFFFSLRSLIWLLADQQPSLISYIRSSYDKAGQALFDGANAWYKLSQILSDLLCDNELPPVYIIIDALDECTTGRTEFLHLIQTLSNLPKVKLLVSSRNWPEIGGKLVNEMNLSLEVNAGLVKTAVELYISYKASQLPILQDEPELKEEVCRRMRNKANGTFLWVAIVFKSLDSMRYYDDNSEVLKMLDEMPEDLTQLYATMLERISLLPGESSNLCRTALAIATLVYRPLHLNEPSTLAGFQRRLKKLPLVEELIKDCGSFLTVQENKIYFIHQSAKEYLASDVSSQSFIFPERRDKVHYSIVSNSLDAMSRILRENIYKLEHPETLIDDVCPPKDDPLDPILYACVNWVAHLCEVDAENHLNGLIDKEKILGFLKTHLLHWLEALSLTRNLSANIGHVKRFNKLLENATEDDLQKFVHDASRFMQYHSQIIENAPMQIYSSAILFNPTESLVRSNFIGKLSSWITSTPEKDSHWSPCLQVIEAIFPEAVDIRDKIHVLNHTEVVYDARFSSDSQHLLSVTSSLMTLWDIISGEIIWTSNIGGLQTKPSKLRVSRNGKFLAVYLGDGSLQTWNIAEATKCQLSWQHFSYIQDIKWSDDSKLLYITTTMSALLWDVARGTPKMQFNHAVQLCFSNDSKFIAFIDEDFTNIVIWDMSKDEKVSMVSAEGDFKAVSDIEFSNDSTLLAVANGNNVRVWDIATVQGQHHLNFGTRHVSMLRWSSGSEALAVVFSSSVEIYDLTEARYWDSMVYGTHRPYQIIFSADYKLVATKGELLKIWDSTTGSEIRALSGASGFYFDHIQFSPDSRRIYSYGRNDGFRIWDIASGSSLLHLSEHLTNQEIEAAFSLDGSHFAFADQELRLWNLATNEMVSHSIAPETVIDCLALSNNAAYLVSVSEIKPGYAIAGNTIDVWSIATGEKLWTVEDSEIKYIEKQCETCGSYGMEYSFRSIAISDDGMVLHLKPSLHGMSVLSDGKKIFELPICSQYFDPYFDIDSQYILIAQAAEASSSEAIYDYQKNVLWLPLDHRPVMRRAISRHCLVMGTVARQVCIVKFSGPPHFEFLS
ncbi:hypothetical protein ACQKWADRAFT_328206 [Trichoderma austrokoningii]